MQFGLFGGARTKRGVGFEDSQGYDSFIEYVIEADRLGFRQLFMVEHHFTSHGQVSASMTVLSYLAAKTRHIRLGTAVVVVPWHNPVLVAEQVATLDLLSGGRVDFGVGKGYRHNEFVGFAVPMEEADARFNEALDESQRMMFRVGVHLGEVIVDQEDQNIFGDGVNLAARIQAIAEPGGIAVSRAVKDVTELRIDYAFVDGGEHAFKNVSRPVHVYHIRTASGASTKTTTRVVPLVVLRLEGADSAGQKYGFDVALDKLMAASQGMVIGRAAEQCELVVAHATVSRRHARLSLAGETLQVEDLGSTNGTSVNGTALRSGTPATLQVGGKLRLGDVKLTVRQL